MDHNQILFVVASSFKFVRIILAGSILIDTFQPAIRFFQEDWIFSLVYTLEEIVWLFVRKIVLNLRYYP